MTLAKERKTREELCIMLMQRVREHATCSHVVDVSIIRAPERNWDTAWTVEGREVVCPAAFEIARELRAQYDLDE